MVEFDYFSFLVTVFVTASACFNVTQHQGMGGDLCGPATDGPVSTGVWLQVFFGFWRQTDGLPLTGVVRSV